MTTFLRTSGSRPWASMVGYSSLRLNSRTGLLSGPTRRGESASIHCFRLATADRPQSSLNGTMAFCGRHVGQRVSVHRTIFMIISTTKCRALIKIWAKCNKYLYMLCASKWSMALCSFARVLLIIWQCLQCFLFASVLSLGHFDVHFGNATCNNHLLILEMRSIYQQNRNPEDFRQKFF